MVVLMLSSSVTTALLVTEGEDDEDLTDTFDTDKEALFTGTKV